MTETNAEAFLLKPAGVAAAADAAAAADTTYNDNNNNSTVAAGMTTTTTTLPVSATTRKAVFSSSQEEPIVMSLDVLTLALLDQNSPLADASNTNTTRQSPMFHFYNLHSFETYDASTSTLTRHQSKSGNAVDLMATLVQDMLQVFFLHQKDPRLWPHFLPKLWHILCQQVRDLVMRQSSNTPMAALSPPFRMDFSTTVSHQTQQQQQQQQQIPKIHGIPNFGQTCFLNTVLQSLASLDAMLAYNEWIVQYQRVLQHHATSITDQSHNNTNNEVNTVS